MGREIRRVPPDWGHPRQSCKHSPWTGGCDDAKAHGGQCYHPLFDESYREAVAGWKAGYEAWERGEDEVKKEHPDWEYWDYHGNPPDREYYRPDWPEGTATAYQVYETVSEGTPVSPVFAMESEIVDWLVSQGRSRHAAEQFVRSGWAPSMVISGGILASNVDVYDILPGRAPASPPGSSQETQNG
jgi:hypothetical protein